MIYELVFCARQKNDLKFVCIIINLIIDLIKFFSIIYKGNCLQRKRTSLN